MKLHGTTVVALALAMAAIEPAASQTVTVATIPPETINSRTSYASANRRLTVACQIALRGLCYVFITDENRAKAIVLRSGMRTVVSGVSTEARVCVVGRNLGATCDLTSVEH